MAATGTATTEANAAALEESDLNFDFYDNLTPGLANLHRSTTQLESVHLLQDSWALAG